MLVSHPAPWYGRAGFRQNMNVPLIDLAAQHQPIRQELFAAIARVYDAQAYILGPSVKAFEADLCRYLGVDHAIGVASGTDALYLALAAMGVGPGDEVITTPFTFFATASAIIRTGATPVFADIEPQTFNLDSRLVESRLTPRTRAILPVHLFGQCAEMESLLALAARQGIPIVEDAAQAIGAERHGRRAGTLGQAGCLSFFPTKNLGGWGDGGAIVTPDASLAARLLRLRVHGSEVRYEHEETGLNSRLDAVQAAILSVKLKYVEPWGAIRHENAYRYAKLFTEAGLLETVTLPVIQAANRHVFNQFTIRVPRRDGLKTFLTDRGIGTEVYYPIPLHLQPALRGLGYRPGAFPEAERASREVLTLPVAPGLTPVQQAYVVDQIRAFYAS